MSSINPIHHQCDLPSSHNNIPVDIDKIVSISWWVSQLVHFKVYCHENKVLKHAFDLMLVRLHSEPIKSFDQSEGELIESVWEHFAMLLTLYFHFLENFLKPTIHNNFITFSITFWWLIFCASKRHFSVFLLFLVMHH